MSGIGGNGGGGAALGGAVFVREGGTLILNDTAFQGSYTVIGGIAGGSGATAGQAHGAVMFLDAGTSTTIGVSSGNTITIDANDAIAGAGALTKAGGGTLVLGGTSSYTGGTLLNGGTLHLEVAKAAGTGQITFGAGSQTLSLENATFASVGSDNYVFQNVMQAFGPGDAIDLTGVDPTNVSISYNAGTGFLAVSAGSLTYAFMVLKPSSVDFVTESDGAGGMRIVLGEGVTIVGTGKADVIDAKHTVAGQPLPGAHADWIQGKGGNDKISGHGGNDWLQGGAGRDHLKGGKGDDRLEGGRGDNKLKGGKGEDVFVFAHNLDKTVGKSSKKADGHARIKDFEIGKDLVELDADVFAAVGSALEAGEFRHGKRAKDDDDHIFYHAKSGRLFYDEDGKGGADAVQVGRLDKKLDLDEGHFLVA